MQCVASTYLRITQPSSARRRACSQALVASEASMVGPACEAVSQVLTTRLVLASSWWDWELR